jgi:hypothetical protein
LSRPYNRSGFEIRQDQERPPSLFVQHEIEVEPATPSLQDVLYIGADEYETDAERAGILANGGVPIGIGENTVIRNAIIDKNARIGKNCHITNKDVSVKRWMSSVDQILHQGVFPAQMTTFGRYLLLCFVCQFCTGLQWKKPAVSWGLAQTL